MKHCHLMARVKHSAGTRTLCCEKPAPPSWFLTFLLHICQIYKFLSFGLKNDLLYYRKTTIQTFLPCVKEKKKSHCFLVKSLINWLMTFFCKGEAWLLLNQNTTNKTGPTKWSRLKDLVATHRCHDSKKLKNRTALSLCQSTGLQNHF